MAINQMIARVVSDGMDYKISAIRYLVNRECDIRKPIRMWT